MVEGLEKGKSSRGDVRFGGVSGGREHEVVFQIERRKSKPQIQEFHIGKLRKETGKPLHEVKRIPLLVWHTTNRLRSSETKSRIRTPKNARKKKSPFQSNCKRRAPFYSNSSKTKQ